MLHIVVLLHKTDCAWASDHRPMTTHLTSGSEQNSFLLESIVHGFINYEALKQQSVSTPSHYFHHVWLSLCCYCGMLFHFQLISPQNIYPETLGLFFFFSSKCESSLNQHLVSSWTLTLSMVSKACSSLNLHLGSFVTSWMSHWCILIEILVGQPLFSKDSPLIQSSPHLEVMPITVVC